MKKRKLTKDQEFQIFKLVLNKFLWVGVIAMIYGMYVSGVTGNLMAGGLWMLAGIIVMLLLVLVIIGGYEIEKL